MENQSKSNIIFGGLSVGFTIASWVRVAPLGLRVVLGLGFAVIATVLIAVAIELLIE